MTSIDIRVESAEEIEKDDYFYALKKRIYQSAKEGYSLNLILFLNKIESAEVKAIVINQVSSINFNYFIKTEGMTMRKIEAKFLSDLIFPERALFLLLKFSFSSLFAYICSFMNFKVIIVELTHIKTSIIVLLSTT